MMDIEICNRHISLAVAIFSRAVSDLKNKGTSAADRYTTAQFLMSNEAADLLIALGLDGRLGRLAVEKMANPAEGRLEANQGKIGLKVWLAE